MPDLDLIIEKGAVRVFDLLHDARPVLLDVERSGGVDSRPWADRVKLCSARYDGTWQLPVIGSVTVPTAVLIRPDGYVAWVGDGNRAGLDEALAFWFGSPCAA